VVSACNEYGLIDQANLTFREVKHVSDDSLFALIFHS
jgi:hypothetical protein